MANTIARFSRVNAILFIIAYVAYISRLRRPHASSDIVPAKVEATPEAQKISSQDAAVPPRKVQLRLWVTVCALLVSTALVSICAVFMTTAINKAFPLNEPSTIPRNFVGLVLLPTIGNAAEHWTTVIAAVNGQMNRAIGIVIKSSIQLAFLVIPFSILFGWVLGNENMDLTFDIFELSLLCGAIILAYLVTKDGRSMWSVALY